MGYSPCCNVLTAEVAYDLGWKLVVSQAVRIQKSKLYNFFPRSLRVS